MTRKNYYAIDIMKFISAIFVIYMHTSPLKNINNNLDYIFFSISRIAVPFFLVTSGYLFFKKIEKDNGNAKILFHYLKRIFILYLIWSILMLPLSIMSLKNHGVINGILTYLRDFIFVGSYFQLWYYPALILGILLAFYSYKKMSIQYILVLSTLIYIVGLLGNSYRTLVPSNNIITSIWTKYFSIFVTTRNGFFYAFLFIVIGLLIAKHKLNISKHTNILLLVISTILLIIESFMLINNGAKLTFDICIMLIPTAFLLVNLLINIDLLERPIYRFFRNSSVLIFGIHKMFIYISSFILSKMGFKNVNSIGLFILTVIFSVSFSIIVLKLENKKGIKVLKYLH